MLNANVTCPACQRPAISTAGKYFRGPGRRFECMSCGQRLGISAAGFAIVPILIAPYLSYRRGLGIELSVLVFVVAMAVASYIHLSLVPLVKK